MHTVMDKVQKISKILERYPDDKVVILDMLQKICLNSDDDQSALENIINYLVEKIPLVYSNPATVQIYAEMLDKSLDEMFEQKDELLAYYTGTLLLEGACDSPLIEYSLLERRKSLGMKIETAVMSDGIAEIIEAGPDMYYLNFGDTATWISVGTYVNDELYTTCIYSRYEFELVSKNYNCYQIDNIYPFEVTGKIGSHNFHL